MKKIDGDITEDAYQRIKAMVGDEDKEYDPVKDVNLTFSTSERLEIYAEVMAMLKSGEPDYHIAQHVVGILNMHIAKRMKQADDRKKGKSPVFRRVG